MFYRRRLTERTEGAAFLYLFSRFLFAVGFAVAIDAAMDDGDAYASSVDLSGGSVDMGCGEAVTRLELRGLGYRVSLLPMCDIVDTSNYADSSVSFGAC